MSEFLAFCAGAGMKSAVLHPKLTPTSSASIRGCCAAALCSRSRFDDDGQGSEVADPKATDICLEAQEHVLAGRWLDMADLECTFVICSLVTNVGSKNPAA